MTLALARPARRWGATMMRAPIVPFCLSLLGGCASHESAPPPAPVKVEGDARDLRRLAGTWLGAFTSEENDRHGTISFSLAAASDTAYGSVTLEAPASVPVCEVPAKAPAPSHVTGRIVLRVAGLTTSTGSVGGWMRPYRDPGDGCWADTWFEGRVRGDSLSGTYFSRHTEAEPIRRGNWWAVRNYTWR